MKFEKLSEIAEIIMGQSPPSSFYSLQGQGLPFFQGKADFGDMYPKVRVFCNKPQKIAQAGDILISVRAPVGPTNINPEKSCIGRGLAALRCGKRINEHYLLYFLRFHEPKLAQLSNGSTFDAISRDDLENILVPLPSLSEQKRIAAILAKTDRLRRLRRYALELSGTYLQSVFLEMFGDPETNSKNYPTVRLSEHISLTGGYAFKSEDFVNAGIPVIRIGTVNTGTFNAANLVYLPESSSQTNSRFLLYPGDLVITLTGTVGKDDYANVCILGNHFHKYFLNQRVAKITTNADSFTNEFILYVFRCPFVKRTLTNPSRGIRQANISNDDILNLRIPQPPLYLQQKFSQIAQRYERLQAQQREAERQAEHLFQTLLHKAFQGELSLDKDEVLMPDVEMAHHHMPAFADVVEPINTDAYQLALPME